MNFQLLQKKAPEIKLESPKKISENTEREEAEKKQLEIEMQIKQQEAELKRKDAIERSKRLQKEKDEEERIKKLKEEEKNAAESERKRNYELEERKRKEKEALEEEERKKRWISENTIKQEDDKMTKEISKKDELLAKLSLLDNEKKGNNSINQMSDTNETKTSKKFETISSLPPKPSFKNEQLSNSNDYKFSQTIENLHDGKPASSSRESNKNELLNKLFGNNNSIPSTNDTFSFSQTKSNQQQQAQSKLDKVDDIFSPKASTQNKLTQQASSKVNLLPWEIDDLNFNISSNQRAAAVANFGSTNNNKANNSNLFNDTNNLDSFFSMNNKNRNEVIKKPNEKLDRPKMENKLIFSSNHHKNNAAFVEDIEELAL
jgi:hypothetical protein